MIKYSKWLIDFRSPVEFYPHVSQPRSESLENYLSSSYIDRFFTNISSKPFAHRYKYIYIYIYIYMYMYVCM